jgi:hypothetical protein
MDNYNKIKSLKSEFGNMIVEYEMTVKDCIDNNNDYNLEKRIDNVEKCLKLKCNKQLEKINKFKSKYNLTEKDNWSARGQLDDLEKTFDLEQSQKEFPLSNDTEWRKTFNEKYKSNGNYLKSYFDTNDMILYNEKSRQVRNMCINNKTFGAEGLIADELIKCINRSKKIINDYKS